MGATRGCRNASDSLCSFPLRSTAKVELPDHMAIAVVSKCLEELNCSMGFHSGCTRLQLQ